MKKILLCLLLLPSLGFGQSLYEYQNLSKYRVRVGELVLNGEKIRPVASDSGQILQFDGTRWKNATKNGESDPFYKIDSLALNRSMRAFVRDSGNYVWWGDTTQTTGAGIASRFDNSLKQNLLVNSAGLAGALSDETGTLKSVFSNEPTFTSKITVNGNVIINTNGTSTLLSTKKADNTDGFNVFFGGGGQSVIYDGVNSFSGSYNTANGYYALQSNTTGQQNTANGYNALYLTTTGSYNTAIGYSSLYSNTTGQQNTANGYSSLRSNTTGAYNTANGYSSLYSNTTGQQNTANGYSSLYSNTTGAYNTANGANALYSNTTGAYNTGNGVNALYSNTTGAYNTADGANSLRSNTTGIYNTANGLNVLYSNTTGSYNTANGFASLYSNTTGAYNTGNGLGSLRSNTTGTYNTANGVNSGRWITGFVTANTTSDYCVFIGDSTSAKADNDQNEIVIGHAAVGNGSNTATYGNNKITNHVFTAGNLGVAGEITKGSEVSKVPGVMFTQTANKTISNTTTETTLVGTGVGSTSLPTLSLIAGKTIRIQLSGYLSCVANDSTTINIKVGSTTLVSSKVKIPVSMTNTEFIADFTFTCRTTGATGTAIGQGSTTLFEGQAFTTSYSRALQMTSTATVNTTVINALDATYKFNAARATNSITVTNLSIEILN